MDVNLSATVQQKILATENFDELTDCLKLANNVSANALNMHNY